MKNEQSKIASTPTYGFYKALKGAVSLEIEDLFLLESFQIAYFPGWVPEKELAAVLHSPLPRDGLFRERRSPAPATHIPCVQI